MIHSTWKLPLFLILILTLSAVSCSPEDDPTNTNDPTIQSVVEPEFLFVKTQTKNLEIPFDGRLKAEKRLELFSEVPGIIVLGEKPFREGVRFEKGETILRLDDEEAQLQLQSMRSGFQTLIASLIPDLKMDHPEEFPAFEKWFNKIKPSSTLPVPPEVDNVLLNRILTSRGVYESFYKIKSAEQRLYKFTLKAPFSGVISAENVEPGQSVSPQVHLGSFIDPDRFILTVSIQNRRANLLSVGMESTVRTSSGTKNYEAEIRRINPSLNLRTQSIDVYLEVSGENLREGMYLEGVFTLEDEIRLAQIPKSALLRSGHVYKLENKTIRLVPVDVENVEREMIWVSGLSDGDEIITSALGPLGGLNTTREK